MAPAGVSEMSHSSFEQDEADEAEVFGQAAAEDPVWVAMPDLGRRTGQCRRTSLGTWSEPRVEGKLPANAQKSRLSWLCMGLSSEVLDLRDPHCALTHQTQEIWDYYFKNNF